MPRMSYMPSPVPMAATLLLLAGQAHASQGPGTVPGTASPLTQMTMAIVVYGLCAAALAVGAIGLVRKNPTED